MRLRVVTFLVLFASPQFSAIARAQTRESNPVKVACELTTEDYAVYSAVLDNPSHPQDPEEEWRNKTDFVLSDKTYDSGEKDKGAWGLHSSSKQLPLPETAESYEARKSGDCLFQSRFTTRNPLTLIAQTEIVKVFMERGDGWKRFYERYPKSSGYWNFSTIGYSKNGLEALVYLGHHCGYMCGTGHLVLLAKESGTWTVKNRVMLWIS